MPGLNPRRIYRKIKLQLALDLKNAHNEYDRRAAQQRLVEHETAQPHSAA